MRWSEPHRNSYNSENGKAKSSKILRIGTSCEVSIAAQWVKLLALIPTSHIGVLILVLPASLPTQLPVQEIGGRRLKCLSPTIYE